MKGRRKRQKSGYQKGYQKLCYNKNNETDQAAKKVCKEYVRLDQKTYETVLTSQVIGETGASASNINTSDLEPGFLRPKKTTTLDGATGTTPEQDYGPEAQSYRVIHLRKNEEFWNFVFKDHREQHPRCKGFLRWDMGKEQQWGIGWRECARCDQCTYLSPMIKLYEEIPSFKKGQKMATCNVGLQIGLTQTPISSASLRRIFLCANIPAPSVTGLQHCANFVNKLIEKVNNQDMSKIISELKDINELCRLPKHELDTELDCMYNNPLYSGVGKTPMQPATQITCIQAENSTPFKYIISLITKNKLCSYHKDHDEKFEKCVHPQGECSANIPLTKSPGAEEDWAYESLENVNKEGIEIRNLTTDADSGAYKAAMKMFVNKKFKKRPIRSIDTTHFARNHRKNMNKSSAVAKMMPGRNKTVRNKIRNKFSNDLSRRCQAEFQSCLNTCGSDKNSFFRTMSHVVDAVNLCYLGDHRLCKANSFVCSQGKGGSNWIQKSEYLHNDFKIEWKSEFATELRKWIEFRLGRKALETTKYGTTTQKVEATNRSLRRSLPRNITFSKNFPGRAHSAVHSVNHGPGESLYLLLKSAKCPVLQGSKVHSGLKQEQKYDVIRKDLQKTDKFKQKRRAKRRKMYDLYEKQSKNHLYEKNISMPKLDMSIPQDELLRRKMKQKSDHPYHKSDKNS